MSIQDEKVYMALSGKLRDRFHSIRRKEQLGSVEFTQLVMEKGLEVVENRWRKIELLKKNKNT